MSEPIRAEVIQIDEVGGFYMTLHKAWKCKIIKQPNNAVYHIACESEAEATLIADKINAPDPIAVIEEMEKETFMNASFAMGFFQALHDIKRRLKEVK